MTDSLEPSRLRLLEPLTIGAGLWLDRFVVFVLANLGALALGGLLIWQLVDFEAAVRRALAGQLPEAGFWGSLTAASVLAMVIALVAQGFVVVGTWRARNAGAADANDSVGYDRVWKRLPTAILAGLAMTVLASGWSWLMLEVLAETSMVAVVLGGTLPLLVLATLTWTVLPAVFLGPAKPLRAVAEGWRTIAGQRLPVLVSVATIALIHGLWSYSSVRVLATSWPLAGWRVATLATAAALETAVVASFMTVASTALYLRLRPPGGGSPGR